MQKFYVIGNLKMNLLSREEVTQYLAVLGREIEGKNFTSVEGIICPPFLYLSQFDPLPEHVSKGAQNIFPEKSGAYTGEISAAMLKNDGVKYVIVGHSERRKYFFETDETVREKALAVEKNHMVPIVCIGETEEERREEKTEAVLASQIRTIFSSLSKLQAEQMIVAYEPRWAIGTDVLPTTQEIFQVRVLLRKLFVEIFDLETAEKIAVVYGGSVKSSFLGAVSWEAQMDGVLVGRESLFPYEVVKMMGLFEEYAEQKKAKKSSTGK